MFFDVEIKKPIPYGDSNIYMITHHKTVYTFKTSYLYVVQSTSKNVVLRFKHSEYLKQAPFKILYSLEKYLTTDPLFKDKVCISRFNFDTHYSTIQISITPHTLIFDMWGKLVNPSKLKVGSKVRVYVAVRSCIVDAHNMWLELELLQAKCYEHPVDSCCVFRDPPASIQSRPARPSKPHAFESKMAAIFSGGASTLNPLPNKHLTNDKVPDDLEDKYTKMLKMGVPLKAVLQRRTMDRAQETGAWSELGTIELKKTEVQTSKPASSARKNSLVPSLDQIMGALKKLRKTNFLF